MLFYTNRRKDAIPERSDYLQPAQRKSTYVKVEILKQVTENIEIPLFNQNKNLKLRNKIKTN